MHPPARTVWKRVLSSCVRMIVLMMTVVIKSAPGGDGQDYSWGQGCAGGVGTSGLGGGRVPVGSGHSGSLSQAALPTVAMGGVGMGVAGAVDGSPLLL